MIVYYAHLQIDLVHELRLIFGANYNIFQIKTQMQDQSQQQQSRNRNQSNNDEFENIQPRHRQQLVVPTSRNKLKACMRCHLLKTEDQWLSDQRCENCEFRGNIRGYITAKYENVVCIIDPSKSWLRKRLNLSRKIVPGSYAVEVFE